MSFSIPSNVCPLPLPLVKFSFGSLGTSPYPQLVGFNPQTGGNTGSLKGKEIYIWNEEKLWQKKKKKKTSSQKTWQGKQEKFSLAVESGIKRDFQVQLLSVESEKWTSWRQRFFFKFSYFLGVYYPLGIFLRNCSKHLNCFWLSFSANLFL